MSETDRSYSYRTSCARIAGRAHLQNGTPCQDYVAARAQHDFACLALADGAGSKTYSEQGARAVVKVVTRLLRARFENLWTLSERSPEDASAELIEHCLAALERHAAQLQCQTADLASTLMFVAHHKGRYLAGHLGDGCIVHQHEDGQVVVLSHPENGEYANTTFFVTDAKARKRLRWYRGECANDSGFVVMSDGTAESLYRRSDKTPASAAVRQLMSWNRRANPSQMREVLLTNLERSIASKTTDDCSIGIMSL